MYAFIRRYRMGTGSVDDLMRKVDRQFASRIGTGADDPSGVPAGIVSYQAIDTGDGTIVTVTLFETEQACRRAAQGAENIRLALAEFQVEEIGTFTGPVMLSRADATLLTPIMH
ncbi:hypothetical protein MF672_021095 [Actinomadura sp. ATCC 31491]|uniref:ABM domain-containing protein n=1 Tax=Actinomadura luzonensis TaxID=2805427 RepID=A0ABT0FVB5_9ACTN|nr:hypothetical protein [Actinomadura luzonensis]MCK2216278.1 hypothetical protein [Actinomadura luzonensis]